MRHYILWKMRTSKNKVLHLIGFMLSPKVRGVCYICGEDYCYSMEDPTAPSPWTKAGKMDCLDCFDSRPESENERQEDNHPRFITWQKSKEAGA